VNQSLRCSATRCLGPLIALAVGLAGLAGCTTAPKAPGVGAATVLQKPGFTQTWATQVVLEKGDQPKALYLLEDGLHVITAQNFDHVLAADSGDLKFFNFVTNRGEILGKPLLTRSNLVYITTYSLEIYTKHGRQLRSETFPFNFTTGGVSRGDTVYVGENNAGGRLAALDVTERYNLVRWEVDMLGIINGGPAYTDESIFSASSTGAVYSCDQDKHPDWVMNDHYCYQTGGPVIADVRADHFGVYVANTDGRLYVIDRNSGKLKWQYFANVPLKTPPQVTKDTVYQFVDGLGLVALDKSKPVALGKGKALTVEETTRYPRWTNANATKVIAQDDKYVYVQSTAGGLLALDRPTGQMAFHSETAGYTAFAVNEKDATIYATRADGTVMSIKPQPQIGVTGRLVMVPAAGPMQLAMAE